MTPLLVDYETRTLELQVSIIGHLECFPAGLSNEQ